LSRRGTLASLIVAAFLVGPIEAAWGQSAYPNRAVKFVIQYTAGGLGDTFARALGQHLAEKLGQPFVIENRAGANGLIAMETVAKSPPDGYTVAMATQTGLVMNAATKKKLPFDPVRDFAPVSLLFRSPFFLIVHPSVPANSVQELIALAKAAPGKYTYASIGRGSGQHLAGEQFKVLAGIDLLHVPYKGSGPATADLLSGQVHMMFEGGVSGLPPVRAGKMKALAVSTTSRSGAMPTLPTMIEAGVPGFELATWFGFAVPAGTPKPIIDRLNAEIHDMLRAPITAQRFANAGIDLIPSTPDEMAARIREDIPKYTKIMRQAGIEAE
jgi:tripartite-type tricarboxylate transporter receptor subunit TctC